MRGAYGATLLTGGPCTKRSEEKEEYHPYCSYQEEGACSQKAAARSRGWGDLGTDGKVSQSGSLNGRSCPEGYGREENGYDRAEPDDPDQVCPYQAIDPGREKVRNHHRPGQEHYRPRPLPGVPDVHGGPVVGEEEAKGSGEDGDPDEVQEYLGRGKRDDRRESRDGNGYEGEDGGYCDVLRRDLYHTGTMSGNIKKGFGM